MSEELMQNFPFLTRKMLTFEHSATFQLRLSVQSTAVTTLLITGATRAGLFTLTHITGATGAEEVELFSLTDAPIWISVINTQEETIEGMVFARVALVINENRLHALVAGYVDLGRPLTWPVTQNERSIGHIGELVTITGADPAAGAEISVTVPDNFYWKIMSVRLTLVTDATAANRRVHLVINNGTIDMIDILTGTNQTASLTRNHNIYADLTFGSTSEDDDYQASFPANFYLPPGFILKTQTTNLAAGDNYGAPLIYVERFLTLSI